MWTFRYLGTILLVPFISPNRCDAASPSSRTSTATCPARTVNYITHGLAQQCLPYQRTALSSTNALSSSASALDATITLTEPLSHREGSLTPQSSIPSDTANATEASSASIPIDISTVPASEASATNVALSSPLPMGDTIIEESLLDSATFLSFEDWKKQNLHQTGQSESIGRERNADRIEPRKRPTSVESTLFSLGDDAEIDIDFTGFVPPSLEPKLEQKNSPREESHGQSVTERLPKVKARGNEAGTTSKERFNYASFDCAANVLKTNPQAKGASSVLGENKDSYMLNECSAESKYLILELCNDIQIDTVVLANFEFFSSTFRVFRISVSDKYPIRPDKWKDVGTWEARNSRDIQAFLVANPVIWARYVRFEFLTHYGTEFYCPLSLVRIHGTTMMEEYKHDLYLAQDDEDEDDPETMIVADQGDETIVPEAIAEVLLGQDQLIASTTPDDATTDTSPRKNSSSDDSWELDPPSPALHQTQWCPSCYSLANATFSLFHRNGSTLGTCAPWEAVTLTIDRTSSSTGSRPTVVSSSHSDVGSATTTKHGIIDPTWTATSSASAPTALSESNGTTLVENRSSIASTSPSDTTNGTNTLRIKSATSITQSSAPAPTMQESFFKSVQKRLQMLETNSSLSLQYIEEQSRALRDAFSKVEQRQLAKTGNFLDYLNTTVLNELRDFRQQYDHLWHSTVIELDTQRELLQHEASAINARLGVLADEVIFQKRMAIVQLVLILLCLGLVLFSRDSQNYLELPLVQSMLNRSHSTRWMSSPGPGTPSQSPPLSRPSSSHQHKASHSILKQHRSDHSEDSTNESMLTTATYSPPTPVSVNETMDHNENNNHQLGYRNHLPPSNNLRSIDPVFDPADIERPGTSPPILASSTGNSPMLVSDASPLRHVSTVDAQVMESPGPRGVSPTSPYEKVDSEIRPS